MIIEKLKIREKQVIAHEMAHKSVGGPYTGAVHYTYTYGPDGKRYISGGEVSIDVSPEGDPEETIRKMQIVRAAALAPVDPSPQDLAVAQRATAIEMKAKMELMQKKYRESQTTTSKERINFNVVV
ncbi:MAG: hypothetical protein N2327_07855 [Caldimicrobium sp.]|nr:hypothetical protein [Caldimicrobium sp.]MCX7874327.1 hypothetical protein [Caldimicrobium sp.]MDW8094933.1 putative metalloprotease CJM1_0395 family protein [Caldimicrobium sp.]